MARWVGRCLAVAGLATAACLLFAIPAAADIVDPPGSCVGSATWQTGLPERGGSFSETSAAHQPGDVIEVPRADTVEWSGQVVGPAAGTERAISGSVKVLLPAPLGGVTIGDWGGSTDKVDNTGTRSYDLPGLVPAGVEFTLSGTHSEGSSEFCSGSVKMTIAGGAFDSPLVWGAIAGDVLFGAGLLLAGRRVVA
ncbi:MAG: hypothetical protein L0Y54_11020 [Sporichthyaceae bacterium]|nr:hypothetical protein [Sporichthyaceae bacterium]